MDNSRGRNIIHALQRKWTGSMLFAHLLFAITITLIFSVIAINALHLGWFVIPIIFILFSFLIYRFFYKKISAADVSTFLNKALPELQESADLVLKPFEKLNFIEQLQVQQIDQFFNKDIQPPKTVTRKLKASIIFFLAALITCLLVYIIADSVVRKETGRPFSEISTGIKKRETKLAVVDAVHIKITPPAYTRKRTRDQDKFNLVVEEGAHLFWNITTNIGVKNVQLVFNDKSVLNLRGNNNDSTKWTATRQVKNSGFYHVKIAGTSSELYKVEMIKDQLPVIAVQSPKPHTLIEPGQQQRIYLNVSITDDYGIKNTFISATIASGSGEAVKFKEQQLSFGNFSSGSKKYQLQKQIELTSLGMKHGDELYFYVVATDTYNQEKRSDIYIVRIEDTAQLMEMEGLMSGINIKPEFFRSQRQIIIETEQLLKDRDTISGEEFKKRSNELGVDQKLLRLRYGKFLGEETDVEIGNDHDHDEEGHNEADDFGNAQKIIDEIAHKHDNAEDATFFDAQTKKQLKATLAEMWKAELQLRTIKPKDALPFEYKALKLLKELQQQTRVYVAKTGLKTTPLNPDKRLTGEMDKITQPVTQQNFKQNPDGTIILRKALGVLEQVRNKETLQPSSMEILEQAGVQLSTKAAAQPSIYLSSLEALRRITNNSYKPKDISIAGSALQRMIQGSSGLPQQSNTSPDMKLSQRYFMNVIRRND